MVPSVNRQPEPLSVVVVLLLASGPGIWNREYPLYVQGTWVCKKAGGIQEGRVGRKKAWALEAEGSTMGVELRKDGARVECGQCCYSRDFLGCRGAPTVPLPSPSTC